MLIYKFEKTFFQRLEEFKIILDDQIGISIRDQFKDFLETSIESCGYSAIWQLSRVDCENMNIRYPCEVLGEVINTDFDHLEATFTVQSVQDDSIHLPEVCNVSLNEIFPTVEQENKAMIENIDLTADCLDRFRFFFNFIFFPFDDEDDKDFVKKHLLSRLTLFYDLKNKQISKGTAARIRQLILESKYICSKKSSLEDSFNTEDELDLSCGESKEKARKLLELHLRMSQIKNEIEILSNPSMREIYEDLKFPKLRSEKSGDGEKRIFTVAKVGTLNEQMQLLQNLKSKVDNDAKIQWLSLTEAIAAALYPQSEIYIPSGEYCMSFYEYLNGDVLLAGLSPLKPDSVHEDQMGNYAKLTASEPGSLLFAIDGDLQIHDLIIDCRNVKTGFLIKNGKVTIKNCLIYGTKESAISEAFNISGESKVLIENCVIMDFSVGVFISEQAKINLRNVTVKNCSSGAILDDEAMISLESASFLNNEDVAIMKYSEDDMENNKTVVDWTNKTLSGGHHIYLLGDANKFVGNKSGDVVVAKRLSENKIYVNDESFEDMESSLIN